MFTYAIYNFILWGATLSAYAYEKTESKNSQIIFYVIAFLIPFVFLALRYDIGTDYQGYVDYFYRINSGDIIPKEPGYLFINYFIEQLGLDVQWLFVFFGFFAMLFAYMALPKEGFTFGVFLFIAIFYLYEGYSAVRQGLSIAIMAYAIRYIYEKKFWIYFLWAVVAMMFHLITGLLLLLIYPIVNKKINKFFSMFVILFLFLAIQFTNIADQLFKMVASLIPQYAWYLNSKFAAEATTSYGLVGPLIKVSITLLVMFFKDEIVRKFEYANIALNMYLFYIISYIFHLKISIFGRVEHIFIFSVILSLTYFIKTFDKRGRVIIIFLIGLFYYLMFMRYIANGTRAVDNAVYVNPYQTVLFDRIGEK